MYTYVYIYIYIYIYIYEHLHVYIGKEKAVGMKKRGIKRIENGLGRDLMTRREVRPMIGIGIGIEGVKEAVIGIEGVKEVVIGIEGVIEVEMRGIEVVKEVGMIRREGEMIRNEGVKEVEMIGIETVKEVVIEVEMTKTEVLEVVRELKKAVEKEVEKRGVETEMMIETIIEIVIVIVDDKKYDNCSNIKMRIFYNRMIYFLRF
jgi:hypothetical protein